MADFERRQLEFGLEFVRWSSDERNNVSEGSSKPKKDVQVIRVRGRQPHEFLNSNYLLVFHTFRSKTLYTKMMIALTSIIMIGAAWCDRVGISL